MTEVARSLVLFAAVLLGATVAVAQNEYEPIPPLPLGTVLLTLPSPNVPPAGSWEVRFTHRFGAADEEADRTLLGLDSGATVGIGAAWVPRRDLEVALLRSNVLDTVELAARYCVVQQARKIPVSITLRAGADWRGESGVDDRMSYFAQGIIARRLTPRFELYAIPTYASDAGRSATELGSVATFEHAVNVPIGAAFSLGRGLSIIAELIPPNRDAPGEVDLGWALGAKKALGGHHFEIVATNNPATTVDQYVSSSWQATPLRSDDIHLGFNISRRFSR